MQQAEMIENVLHRIYRKSCNDVIALSFHDVRGGP